MLQVRSIMVWAGVICLLAFTEGLCRVIAGATIPAGRVHLEFVTEFGERRSDTAFRFMTDPDRKDVTSAFTDRVESLPFGPYLVGFPDKGAPEVKLRVDRAEGWYVVSVSLPQIGDHSGRFRRLDGVSIANTIVDPILMGHVSPLPTGRAWVRVVSLYSYRIIDVPISANGEFTIVDTPIGSCELLIVQPPHVLAAVTLDVAVQNRPVEIRIPGNRHSTH